MEDTINALPCVDDNVGLTGVYCDEWKATLARLAMSAATLMPVARMRTRDGYLGNLLPMSAGDFCWTEHNMESSDVYFRDNPWGTLVCVPKYENTTEYKEGLVVTPEWIEDCWDLLDDKKRYYASIIEVGVFNTEILCIITGLEVYTLMHMVKSALDDTNNVSSKILLCSILNSNKYDFDSFRSWRFDMIGFFIYMVVRKLEKDGDIYL